MDSDELSGVTLSPRWEDDITQLGAILFGTWLIRQQRADRTLKLTRLITSVMFDFHLFLIPTQIEVVGVEHELRQIEELGYEFLDVGHVVFGGREPGFTHTVEHPVSQVKVTALVIQHKHAYSQMLMLMEKQKKNRCQAELSVV